MLGSNKKRRLSKDTPSQSRKHVQVTVSSPFVGVDDSSSDDGDIVPRQFRDKNKVFHVVPRLPPKNAPTEPCLAPATKTSSSQTPTKRPSKTPKQAPAVAPVPAPTPVKVETPVRVKVKANTAARQQKLAFPEAPKPQPKPTPTASTKTPPAPAPTPAPERRPANTNPYLVRFKARPRKEINGLEFEKWLIEHYKGKDVVLDSQEDEEDEIEEPIQTIVPTQVAPAAPISKSVQRHRHDMHIADRLLGPIDRSFITYAQPSREFTDGSSDFVAGDFHPHSTHFAMSTSVLTDMYNRPNNLVLASLRKNEIRCLDGHKVPIIPEGNATINPLVQGAFQHSTVPDVRFARDGRFLCSGGYDKTFRVWDTETGECLDTKKTGTNVLTMNKSGPRAEFVAAALQEPEVGIPGRIRVYGISEEGRVSGEVDLVPSVVNFQPACLTFDPAGRGESLVAGFCGSNAHKRWGGLCLFDIATQKQKHALQWSSSAHTDVFWHHSGMIVAASTPRKYVKPPIRSEIRLFREGNKKPIMELGTPQYDLNHVSMSPCGNYVTASGTDNCTLVWDIRSGNYRPLYQLEHGKSIHSTQPLQSTLVFNERRDEGVCGVAWLNNRTLLSGGTDGVVKAWDLGLGKPFLKDIVTMQSCVTTFKMSPDQLTLAVGDGTGHIKTVTAAQAIHTGSELPKFKTIRVGGDDD